jgi:biopolymer transport protein ExbD
MSKFRKDGGKAMPAINTSALPDIVFMLLFFFMVATKMRDPNILVKTAVPQVSEVEKVENKSWVIKILVGPPIDESMGTPRIQLNDKFGSVDDIQDFIIVERSGFDENVKPMLTTSIKSDVEVRMGLIQDIKQELRLVNARKVLYSSNPGQVKEK